MNKSTEEQQKIFTADEKAQKTFDGFDNFVSRVGLNNNNTLSAGAYFFNLMTRNRIQLEAAYRGSWIVGAVIDCIAEDMTKAGIDISTNDNNYDIKDIQARISLLQVWQSLCDLTKWGRLYGGAIGIIQINGQDLSTPLNIDTIGQDQFEGLAVYDRWQLNPSLVEVIKSGPDMGLPEYYYIVNNLTSMEVSAAATIGQVKVHHSRCIRSIGIKLPWFQAITEMMWGESILERMWDRMISFDTATLSSANLIERANNRTIGIENLREIVAMGGKAQQGLEAQFEMMRQFQTNEGITLMDKNDTFVATKYSFAGLDTLLLQFGQQLSGASGIPLVRLFGQSPAGLSATGESDLRNYYDNINARQETNLRSPVDKLLKIIWRSTFGQPPPKDLTFTFKTLWQMSDMDKSTITKTNAETILGAEERGIISKKTAAIELRQSTGNTGIFSNITDEEIEELDEADDLPPMPEPGGEGARNPDDGSSPSPASNKSKDEKSFILKVRDRVMKMFDNEVK